MPNALIVDIAVSITELLNNATLSKSFTAERTYAVKYSLKESPGLKVFVVGTTTAIDLAGGTRAQSDDTHTVMVGLYNTISRVNGSHVSSEVDDMIYLTQEVCDLIKANRVHADAYVTSINVPALFDVDWLEQKDVFLSVVTLDCSAMSDNS